MEAIITFLATLSFPEIILLTCIITLIYILITNLTNVDVTDDIIKIKDGYKQEMSAFIVGQMVLVEQESLSIAKDILKDYQNEYQLFSLVLEKSLLVTQSEIKQLLKVNGFHELDKEKFDQYIQNKGSILLASSRKRLNERLHLYPHLIDTDDVRYDDVKAQTVFRMVIMKAIELKNKEISDIKKTYEKYSIIYKLNIFRMLIEKMGKK